MGSTSRSPWTLGRTRRRSRPSRAAIGGFDISGSDPARWYWSSSQDNNNDAWAQLFSDGTQLNYGKYNDSSLRCVR